MKHFHGKVILSALSLTLLVFLLVSWGSAGHSKISRESALSFNLQMAQFNNWTAFLGSHASDADYRKDTDPNEAPKHYINIDDYTEFVMTGRIPQTLDSVVTEYGTFFVYDKGILPWATKTTYDNIKSCFLQHDIVQAEIYAADLGHYVGDGHMPLHITRNYNGQYSNNYGIHSRYESTMISNNVNWMNYSGDSVYFIQDVNQYIFNYIYNSYTYKDSVLAADTYAKTISSNTNSTAYKDALWDRSKGFTTLLFKNASHALAELLFTAWVDAGSPPLTPSFVETIENTAVAGIGDVYPNPVVSSTKFLLSVKEKTQISLQLLDRNGKIVEVLYNGLKPQGQYVIDCSAEKLSNGLYYLVLNAGNYNQCREMLVIK